MHYLWPVSRTWFVFVQLHTDDLSSQSNGTTRVLTDCHRCPHRMCQWMAWCIARFGHVPSRIIPMLTTTRRRSDPNGQTSISPRFCKQLENELNDFGFNWICVYFCDDNDDDDGFLPFWAGQCFGSCVVFFFRSCPFGTGYSTKIELNSVEIITFRLGNATLLFLCVRHYYRKPVQQAISNGG